MRLYIFHIIIVFILLSVKVEAQLSPGNLSQAHAELEGIYNCTKCHVLGQKVSNDKCLECHQEIKSRIDQRAGYHDSREVKGKECASCHSDHHGRDFEMVRFDEDQFNHSLAGYKLEGAHKIIDCRECHQPDFVNDRDLKKKESTFLGLEQECLSCHTDYHQRTLSNDCAKCHDTKAFSPAANFNHDHTDFTLLGKHKSVECIACHQMETRNGQDFQRFTAIAFENCNSCHQDVHNNNLGTNCKECHVEQSFTLSSGLNNFNHSQTNFALKGKHQQVNCAECHNLNATPLTVFQDRLGVRADNCATCHEDVHDNKFGNNCADCHHEQSFSGSAALNNFNHGLTGFELAGKHQVVDCRECHTASFIEPLPHNECASCHVDYHENEFNNNGIGPDCAECHSVEGFEISLYTIADHNRSKFPLEGAHAATPCFVCHQQDDQWNFRGIGENCVDCHEDVHIGEIDQQYYPNQSCERCHVSIDWEKNLFNHSLTSFKLSGAHDQQKCSACHVPDVEHKYGKFKGVSATCTECHEKEHNRQFDLNGVTDCVRCHGFANWEINKFNHNKTAFKLTGKHVSVACAACHKEIEVNGEIFVQYKFESFECVVCHQ